MTLLFCVVILMISRCFSLLLYFVFFLHSFFLSHVDVPEKHPNRDWRALEAYFEQFSHVVELHPEQHSFMFFCLTLSHLFTIFFFSHFLSLSLSLSLSLLYRLIRLWMCSFHFGETMKSDQGVPKDEERKRERERERKKSESELVFVH